MSKTKYSFLMNLSYAILEMVTINDLISSALTERKYHSWPSYHREDILEVSATLPTDSSREYKQMVSS